MAFGLEGQVLVLALAFSLKSWVMSAGVETGNLDGSKNVQCTGAPELQRATAHQPGETRI